MTQAQEGASCTYYNFSPVDVYLQFDEDRHIAGTIEWYTNNDCTVAGGEWEVPADGWVLKVLEADAIAACTAALGGSNEVIKQFDIFPSPFATFNQQVWQCHNTSAPKEPKGKTKYRYVPKVDPRPTGVILNEDTDLRVSAVNGLHSGIEFQRRGPAAIGIQSVLDLGFLDAVDVWSYISGPYEVCFPQLGRIIFLDAATSPRKIIDINHFTRDSYICVHMDRAGTVVLVNAPASAEQQGTLPIQSYSNTYDSVSSAIDLEDCTVTPLFHVNLRAAPWGQILDFIPHGTTVPAMARTQSWFNVTYMELEGWSAAWLVDTEGDCDWTG